MREGKNKSLLDRKELGSLKGDTGDNSSGRFFQLSHRWGSLKKHAFDIASE